MDFRDGFADSCDWREPGFRITMESWTTQ